ncbi:MAG: hypothetical protein WBB22_00555, partial [Anaerolineae bacterium]
IMLLASFPWPGVALAQQGIRTPVPATVIVEWTTESEVNQAGFNLYRSENPQGPYVKLNDALIPASLDPITGGSYVYTDTAVIGGATYYYKLEDVELDGTSTLHGPIEAVAQADSASWSPHPALILAVAVLAGVAAIIAFTVLARRISRRSASTS